MPNGQWDIPEYGYTECLRKYTKNKNKIYQYSSRYNKLLNENCGFKIPQFIHNFILHIFLSSNICIILYLNSPHFVLFSCSN